MFILNLSNYASSIFLEKMIYPEVYFKDYYSSFTLTDMMVITSINSVNNLVATGTNPLRKHKIKHFSFSLLIFNQSKIKFKTLDQCRCHKKLRLSRIKTPQS